LAILNSALAVCVTILSCGQGQSERTEQADKNHGEWNRFHAENEYKLIQAELKLTKADQPYMVLDLRENKLKLKLKGAVVWSYPMDFASTDSDEVKEFMKRFRGNEGIFARPVADKYLFAAEDRTPDSVLAIVGEAIRVDPELLQRDLPERFQLLWGNGLILEIRTDISGKPISKLQNAIVQIKQALSMPFGETIIVLKIESSEALSLYRAANRGMVTLIYPPM